MGKAHALAALFAFILVLSVVPLGVSAGSDSQTQRGIDRYEEAGGFSETSIVYPGDGIILSNDTDSGYAVWRFDIGAGQWVYNLSASVFYTESVGNGPNISVYNWPASDWQLIAADTGNGTDRTVVAYANPADCVNSTGDVWVQVYADAGEFIDVGTVSVDWRFDDTPPRNPDANVSIPIVGTWTSTNVMQVSWSGASDDVSGVGGYSIEWSQSQATIPDDNDDTTGSSTVSSELSNGVWYLHIRTVDNGGNWNSSAYSVGPFLIDGAPPSVTINSPSEGAILVTSTVNVSWSGSDADSWIDRYEVQMDTESPIDAGNASSYEFTGVSEGSHTVTVTAFDIAGNQDSSSVSFEIDTLPPGELVVFGPSSWSNDSTPQFYWVAADPGDIQGYSYSMDELPGDEILTQSQTVNWTSLEDGPHTFYVKACDWANNWGEVSSYAFLIDTVLPSLTLTSPSDDDLLNSSTIAVSWSGDDALSGIDRYEVQLDSGSPIGVGALLQYQFNGVSDGLHTINVTAFDRAGNWITSGVYVIVDTIPPQTTVTIDGTMGEGDWYVTAVNVTLTASDISGVKSISYNLNSGGWLLYVSPIQISENGVHTLLYYAEDNASNRNATQSIEIKIDTTQVYLDIDIDDGAILNSSSLVVTWTVYNSVSGIDRYEYSLDSSAFVPTDVNSIELSGLFEGSHTLFVRAIDNAGRAIENSVAFTVDTQSPSIAFSIQDGTIFTTRSVTIAWVSTDETTGIDRFEYSLDGGAFASNGVSTTVTLPDVVDGSHVLAVRAFDAANNSAERSVSFIVDTAPPVLSFPTSDVMYFNTTSVTITWTASDASGIERFEYSLDGSGFVQFGTPNSTSMNISGLSEGTHFFDLRAYDLVGNNVERRLTFIVDTQPPTLSLDVQNGTTFASKPVVISWSSSDEGSGIQRFQYSLDGSTWVSVGTSTVLTLPVISEAEHSLAVRAYDRAGNYREAGATFSVDTEPPSLTFDVPDGAVFNSASVSVGWTSSDAVSGVDYFAYRLDAGDFVTIGSNASVDFEGLSDAAHVLIVQAYDIVGNYRESALTFLVDTQPPIVSLDVGSDATYESSSVRITWTAQDSASGINRYEYSLDGGSFESVGLRTWVNLTGLIDGTHTITIRAFDNAGNFVDDTASFRVTIFRPYVSIIIIVISAIAVVGVIFEWERKRRKQK